MTDSLPTRRLPLSSLVCALALVTWLVPAPTQAGNGFAITIGSPTNGTPLTNTSTFFNAGLQVITVSGAVAGIPVGQERSYPVNVQGTRATLLPLPTGGHTFTAQVWVGPTQAPVPPGYYPYLETMLDSRIINTPIVAEVIDVATDTVLARDRIVLFDTRTTGGVDPLSTSTRVTEGFTFQVTAAGLDHLEGLHTGSLPLPTLAQFNARLEAAARGTRRSSSLPTGFSRNDKACIPIADANQLRLTTAYPEILAVSAAHYAQYQAARRALDSGVANIPVVGAAIAASLQIYIQNECVREDPTVHLDDYEVCVQSLKGNMRDLSLGGVRDVDLEYATTQGVVQADVETGAVDGVVDVGLRDVFLRYTAGGSCSLRPKVDVANQELTSTVALTEWSTCRGLGIHADSARTFDFTLGQPSWENFTLTRDKNTEMFSLPFSSGGHFELNSNRRQRPDVGTCAELHDHVDPLLVMFYDPAREKVESTWKAGGTRMHQALALDDMFAALEFGTHSPADVEITTTFNKLDAIRPSGQTLYDGLHATLSSRALHNAPLFAVAPQWVNTSSDINVERFFQQRGQSYFGVPFDVAFMVSTAVFNQLIHERSKTAPLVYEYTPTWAELGAAPPSGVDPGEPVALTGALMATFVDPAFVDIPGAAHVTLSLRPTHVPFVYMPVEPPQAPYPGFAFGRAPLTYQLGQYTLEVRTDDLQMPVAARLLIDMHDLNFAMDLPADKAVGQLVPAWSGSERWVFSILESNLSTCPLAPSGYRTPRAPTCEFGLAANLGTLVKPSLAARLLDLVAGMPAPTQFTVARSPGSPVRHFEQVDRFSTNQQIWYYGNFVTPR